MAVPPENTHFRCLFLCTRSGNTYPCGRWCQCTYPILSEEKNWLENTGGSDGIRLFAHRKKSENDTGMYLAFLHVRRNCSLIYFLSHSNSLGLPRVYISKIPSLSKFKIAQQRYTGILSASYRTTKISYWGHNSTKMGNRYLPFTVTVYLFLRKYDVLIQNCQTQVHPGFLPVHGILKENELLTASKSKGGVPVYRLLMPLSFWHDFWQHSFFSSSSEKPMEQRIHSLSRAIHWHTTW